MKPKYSLTSWQRHKLYEKRKGLGQHIAPHVHRHSLLYSRPQTIGHFEVATVEVYACQCGDTYQLKTVGAYVATKV